ncbi:MAG: transcriptional repressor LexA [Candidatus Sericytochromatia bacterium]|nr:transcriptional repressor LexA [Candidatus Sericytochromatia bacterium]
MPGPTGQTRQAIYQFIQARLREGAPPPSMREIQAAFGFKAVQSVKVHLDRLVVDGLLTHDPGKARSYRLAQADASDHVPVPIWGRVRAGPLSEAIADPDGTVWVETAWAQRLGRDSLFALHVRGDSMVGAGILEGDLVIARRQPTAQLGEIVVALLETEATVKRLAQHRGQPALLAENPAYAPILPDERSGFRILGKVVEIRRSLT